MKVISIHSDIIHQAEAPDLLSQKNRGKGVCIENRGLKAGYSGSFTGKSEAATSFMDKILKSKWFGKFAKYSNEHNISTSALVALVLAGIMRPATIMALPGKKDKDDKTYAAGHSMASGIIGFLFSTALTSPFDESIRKVFDISKDDNGELKNKNFVGKKFAQLCDKIAKLEQEKEAKTITKAGEEKLKSLLKQQEAMRTFLKNVPDWFIAVPRAMLTIALIPPILKYVFGLEKKKPQEKQQDNQQQISQSKSDFIEKPVFAAFKGGVK